MDLLKTTQNLSNARLDVQVLDYWLSNCRKKARQAVAAAMAAEGVAMSSGIGGAADGAAVDML
jgi:hypothetical protein